MWFSERRSQVAVRVWPELRAIGLFINTLPVRARVRGECEVEEWLKQLQEEQVKAREYEYSSMAEVQQWSEIGAGERLFESLLVYENYPVSRTMAKGAKESTGIAVSEVRGEYRTNYPLTIGASSGQRMELRFQYDKHEYDEVVTERLAGHLQRLLEEMAEEGKRKIGELELLSAEEREQILCEWNDTELEYPGEKCVTSCSRSRRRAVRKRSRWGIGMSI